MAEFRIKRIFILINISIIDTRIPIITNAIAILRAFTNTIDMGLDFSASATQEGVAEVGDAEEFEGEGVGCLFAGDLSEADFGLCAGGGMVIEEWR
jgi:hypothetical protein